MAKSTKAAPRGRRSHPQEGRVLSTNFPDHFAKVGEKCFVPYSDFHELEIKYIALFKRYKREMRRGRK
jgi:hypothetical protein